MTDQINGILWGPVTIGLILLSGVYLTLKTRFIQLRFPRLLKGSGKNRLKAVTSALAASMGTGNITGCVAAIAAGGAGAVFWMWLSAFFGMATAFEENRLGAEYGKKYPGEKASPMLYMEMGLKCKPLAVLYAAGCLLSAFAMGCMSQSGALTESVCVQTGISVHITAILIAALTAAVIFSAESASAAVMRAAEKAVPVMGIFYAISCIALVMINSAHVPSLFTEIFTAAFTPQAAAGGAAGITVKTAISIGLRRGVFSNEAGMGSSVLVHSEADFGTPESVGAWAAFEVFLDTMVCCTLTALAILSSPLYKNGSPLDITAIFTEGMGKTGGMMICISISLFAMASLLGWCIYGEKCLLYLTKKKKADNCYRLLYVIAAAAGALVPLEISMGLADIFNAALIFPNIAAVLILSAEKPLRKDKTLQ